jgi:cell fate regulator YaaT (PSP1 superfamily)
LRAEYTFDRTKIVFFFTADGRVDFRELVKDLAAVFHTRIELRQVGVRDEAKQVSGIGPCGRPLCCATYMGDFMPVSIKMAKTQGLSLNPTKISGACGRLMCCLRYENDLYAKGELTCPKILAQNRQEADSAAPHVGQKVTTDAGDGVVVYVNMTKKQAKVQLGQKTKMLPWDEIVPME